MSVTFPRGFRAAGTTAGMKPSGRPDMGLLVADPVQSVAGLFTTNAFAAAPVRLSAQRVSRGLPRAVVVNSGQANAGTGLRGDRDSERTTAAVADALHLEASDVIACSTGVIGEPLHMDQYLGAIPELVSSLSDEGGDAFAEAIMTTDVVPKVAAAERGGFRVGGCPTAPPPVRQGRGPSGPTSSTGSMPTSGRPRGCRWRWRRLHPLPCGCPRPCHGGEVGVRGVIELLFYL